MPLDPLNWKEIAKNASQISDQLSGAVTEKIIVPERKEWATGYLKNEWGLRFKNGLFLLISLRPQHPALALGLRSPRSSSTAPQNKFMVQASKRLGGLSFLRAEPIDRDRIVRLLFDQDWELVLFLIPTRPNAFLLHSKKIQDSWREGSSLTINPPAKLDREFSIRSDLFSQPSTYYQVLNQSLQEEALSERRKRISVEIRGKIKKLEQRLRTTHKTLQKINQSPPWSQWGDLLKANLYQQPSFSTDQIVVSDYSGNSISISVDRRLSPTDQMKKFYQQGRRNDRKHQDATTQEKEIQQELPQLKNSLATLPEASLEELNQLEKIFFSHPLPSLPSKGRKNLHWSGKIFESADGTPILVGRNKKENLQLTFRIARGNDIWMHARGKPSAHVVILLDRGKTASLETLLEAGRYLIQYSRGRQWGKTEIDYTFQKFVKRIKGSDEVRYTENKTLLVEVS